MRDIPMSTVRTLMQSGDYRERALAEYWYVKDKYERLHRAIIKREAGTLEFTPNCPMEQWKAQAAAMGAYLYQLEIKAEYEHMALESIFVYAAQGLAPALQPETNMPAEWNNAYNVNKKPNRRDDT